MDVLDTSQRIDQERRARINAVWSVDAEKRAAVQGWYWMAHPMVRARINTLIAGDPDCDAYGRLERLYRERGWRLPIGDAISLGCGFGNLERDLVGRGLVQNIDAYDLAEGAIEQARRLASTAGLQGIRYHVADLDALSLPAGSVDAVFAHQSVHHVERLEEVLLDRAVALRAQHVLHLHRLDHREGLADLDLLPLADRDRLDEARDVKAPLCPLVFCVGRVVHGDRRRVAVAAKFRRDIFGAEFLGELVAAGEQTLRAATAMLG